MNRQVEETTKLITQERELRKKLTLEYEAIAKRDPDGYRGKVSRFALLLDLYVYGAILVGILLMAGILYMIVEGDGGKAGEIKLLLIVGAFVLYLFRSLFIRLKRPEGLKVSRQEAPQLWAEVDRFVQVANAPKVDAIIVNMQMNAAAAQAPAWGFFGPTRSDLIIGLPLLAVLSPEEAKHVLAHEFGHFAGAHGKMGGRIYRLMQRIDFLQEQGGIHGPFLRWYERKLDSMSFALRRQQEFEADALAARLCGAEHERSTLRLRVGGILLERAFTDLHKRARAGETRPASFLAEVLAPLQQKIEIDDKMRAAIRTTMEEPTTYTDTHPCWSERLLAVGESIGSLEENIAYVERQPQTSALQHFLGHLMPGFLTRLETEEYPDIAKQWSDAAKDADTDRKTKARLEAIESRTLEEELELLHVRRFLGEDVDAEYVKHAALHPDNPFALFSYGMSLAEKDDIEAIPVLTKVMDLSPALTASAVEEVARLRSLQGNYDIEDLQATLARAHAHQHVLAQERAAAPLMNSAYIPTTLRQDQVDQLKTVLKGLKIRSAYLLARKLSEGEQNILIAFPAGAIISNTAGEKLTAEILQKLKGNDVEVSIYCPAEKIGSWDKALSKLGFGKLY